MRDVALLPYCEENAHWNNMSKCVFTQADGMTGRVLLVMLMPMTMAAPHPHVFGTEEIWTKITPGNSLTLLGSFGAEATAPKSAQVETDASPSQG